MTPTPIHVRLDVRSSRLRQEFERVLQGMAGFVPGGPTRLGPGGVLVRELGDDPEAELAELKTQLEFDPTLDVLVTAARNDSDLLMAVMRAGIKEFLPQPLSPDEARLALWRIKERQEKAQGTAAALGVCAGGAGGLLIDVLAAKGGAGATTVAVNLAEACLELENVRSAALIDMSLPFGEVQLFLDMHSSFHWGEAVKNVGRLDATYLMTLFNQRPSGLRVLLSPGHMEDMALATPESAAKLITLAKSLFDVVVVDGGGYLDEVSLKVMELSDHVLLTAQQNLPGVASLRRLLPLLRQELPEERIKIVVNRFLKQSDLRLEDAEASLGAKVFWRLPNDYENTLAAINQGKPLKELAPKAAVTRAIAEMAQALVGAPPAASKGSSLLRFFQKK